MKNKVHSRSRSVTIVFFLIVAATLLSGLYPFNFFPSNRVQWHSNEPGIYVHGAGLVHTDMAQPFLIEDAVSVQLLLRERRGSKNWGAKEILSFYDGPYSPSLLVGQWAGRIFLYSRLEHRKGKKWYRRFLTKNRFPRGKAHLVTVTFDDNEKAIYVDGQLRAMKKVELTDGRRVKFSGSLLVGSSPRGKNGWHGEIKGLAVYNRILLPNEIAMHSRKSAENGIGVLAKTPGCLAAYPFDEGKGNTARSLLGGAGHFSIPDKLNSLSLSSYGLLSLGDMRFYGFNESDFFKNILFFVPFGGLLSAVILKKTTAGYLANFLMVTLVGGILSCAIEGLQLLLYTRSSGIADIVANMLGSGIGMQLPAIALKGNGWGHRIHCG